MRPMKRLLLCLLLLGALLATPLHAAQQYQIVPRGSLVRFTVTKFLVERVNGDFHDFRGTIHYNPERPDESSIEMHVVVRSVVSGARGRDRTLQDEDFFHSQRYPLMTFRSVGVARRDDGTLDVTGDLTIRGVTRRITVPVRVTEQSGALEFEATFTLDRTDFGVNGTRWSGGRAIISREADVRLRIVARAEENP